MPNGIHFFMNPGPTNIPDRILRAMDRGTMDFNGARFKAIAEECFAGLQARVQDQGADYRLCRDRARGLGGGARQPVLARRQGAGARKRFLLAELGGARRGLRARCRNAAQRLAARLRPGEARSAAARGPAAPDQGGAGGAQRDLDRGGAPGRRTAPRDRRGQAPGLVPGRYDLLARLVRLPHGRVGRRRRRRRLAEGADAADRHGFHRDQREGDRRLGDRETAAGLLGLEPAARHLAGHWNGTVPVHFFYGLQEALRMLEEEGLDNVFARHHRLAEATRRAVRAWAGTTGPEMFCDDPGRSRTR